MPETKAFSKAKQNYFVTEFLFCSCPVHSALKVFVDPNAGPFWFENFYSKAKINPIHTVIQKFA